jgi:hypothetical protein
MLFRETLPQFAEELTGSLRLRGEAALESQVTNLAILQYEITGDAVVIYTEPKPAGAFGPTLRNVQLDVPRGMVVLDVVNERIACIEVLGRGDVRAQLRGL